ncbi:methylated-DNA--protein-cysteine methyltransferase isoform X5 [Vidua chalybeata]|nr:methylated-DNA--protein-cysteine methyltransferase isoform X5 [Vidua chalybeata]XP_053805101.1 methylated-DNA--protein-cysteine methyltransferase isoform X5 [Vidua chalybeata]
MASRLVPKVNSKQGGSPCKEKQVVLLSPLGRMEISGCEAGVHEIKLPKMSLLPSGRAEPSVACEVCEGAEEMPEPLQQCTAWLRAYFCEPATTGTLPVPAFHHPLLQRDSFTRQVLWTLLKDVKFGEAVSYKQLADLAGNSRAARAVGGAMRSNPDLGIDEAASENKLFPLWASTQKNKSEVGEKYSAGARIRGTPASIRGLLHIIFLLETNLWVWKFYSV